MVAASIMPAPGGSVCLDVFAECVIAILAGELIESVGRTDKEFHFQNWFETRLNAIKANFDSRGRNTYPDFTMVDSPEGFEIKGLAWPGRVKNYDSNSQVPTGFHNGRHVYYVFGRYPADVSQYVSESSDVPTYPVIDLVVCHGSFLNAHHEYIHKNKSVRGFGSYGDLMIRDRKMYVAPTPYALIEGTTGLRTLILPAGWPVDSRFRQVGELERVEADSLVIGYDFDLQTNEISARTAPNPNAGDKHNFVAYRIATETARVAVSLVDKPELPSDALRYDE